MKTVAAFFALIFLALLVPAVRGDEAVPEYVLGSDDVIDITVLNHKGLDKTLTILPDGTIAYPEIGTIRASGKTPKALGEEIKAGLEKTRNLVVVTVSVKELKSQKARIVGAVKSSGSYDIKRSFRLMDLVALAGGLNVRPGRVTGRIVRESKVVTLDMAKAVTSPDSEANPPIQNGDLVLLEEQDIVKQVRVMGMVEKPGAYDLTETTTVLSLLAEAGGTTEKAWLGRCYILRGQEKIQMNLVPVLLKGQKDESVIGFKLTSGDLLMVPEAEERFAVLGTVNKPGYYPISERQPITLLEALSLAGGQTQEAEMRKAGLLRMVDGKPTPIPVNFDLLLRKGDLAKNVVMQPGDILFVPARSRREMNAFDFLNPLGWFLNIGGNIFR